MSLNIALDELYATGWSDLDSTGCAHDVNGRAYPSVDRVRREFAAAGCTLTIKHVPAFDCYRAEWREADGSAGGAVVAQFETEAAVHALARWRRRVPTSV